MSGFPRAKSRSLRARALEVFDRWEAVNGPGSADHARRLLGEYPTDGGVVRAIKALELKEER